MKHLLTICIVGLLASCSPSLHNTGKYTIKTREGNLTTFNEVRGKYVVESDTLKVNDTITINVIKAGKHKN